MAVDRIMLLGRDHTELGEAAVETVGPVALALTRGRHPKPYPYTEPNEDAVVVAVAADLVLMAVADGHHGSRASHLAAEAMYAACLDLAALPPDAAVTEALKRAGAALSDAPLAQSRPATTLTVVAARRGEGAALGWGDSAAALFHRKRGKSLLPQRPEFVAAGGPVPDPEAPVRFRFRSGDLLVVASDGLTDFVVQPWPQTLADLFQSLDDPTRVVEAAVEAAGEGGGGDNLAIAALRMGS